MSLYREMAATAAQMLAEFGQTVTFERTAPGAYDTASGSSGAARLSCWTAAAVQDADEAGQAGGTLVEAEAIRLLVAAGETAPEVGDAVVLADGTRGAIKAVQPFSPAGEALYYTLKVRR